MSNARYLDSLKLRFLTRISERVLWLASTEFTSEGREESKFGRTREDMKVEKMLEKHAPLNT